MSVETITLKEFDDCVKKLVKKTCRVNPDLTVWDDWSWFYDNPDNGWPIDPFWADDDYAEQNIVVHDDRTENLAVIGVNWYPHDCEGVEGPYVYARILKPDDDDVNGMHVTCGDDIVRTFQNEEEDAYTLCFHAAGQAEYDDRDYALYVASEDGPTPEEWFETVLALLVRDRE
ncbi:hypothetical protein CSQ85_12090 [Bifidobacterium rousetti]|uniref:hypothetical protein n=1 Tax=Bifidobacterium rousetti TaxID=2045439 RepID=UPI001238A9C9|nr:hypothetical protein [Bifidobacterium rousetti]KAA8816158.1 hypothetical protein CSQ85_12090 [Bifidobacterium rousetti]